MADLYEKLKRFQQSTTPSTSPKPEERLVPASHLVSDKTSRLEKLLQAPGLARARDLIGQIEKRDAEKKQFLESIGVVEVSNEAGSFGFRETIFAPRAMGCRVEDFTGPEMVLQTRDETFRTSIPPGSFFWIPKPPAWRAERARSLSLWGSVPLRKGFPGPVVHDARLRRRARRAAGAA